MSRTLKFIVPAVGRISAIYQAPANAKGLFVLGHGTGSDMYHPVISGLAEELAVRDVAVLRYHYPYSDHPDYVAQSGMATDSREMMTATLRTVVSRAADLGPELRLFAGGHSMSADLTSYADSDETLAVQGLILLGYPIRDAGMSHLADLHAPVLFVQGALDHLGSVEDIERAAGICGSRATVQIIEAADHGFERHGVEPRQVLAEVAERIVEFIEQAG